MSYMNSEKSLNRQLDLFKNDKMDTPIIPNIYLHQVARHSTGMYAVLLDNDKLPFAVAIQPGDKCLEPGEYACTKSYYYHGGYPTFEISVPGHTRVLFHKGNHQEDSLLCVVMGESFDIVAGRAGIANSDHAFIEFMSKYKDFGTLKLIVTRKEGI